MSPATRVSRAITTNSNTALHTYPWLFIHLRKSPHSCSLYGNKNDGRNRRNNLIFASNLIHIDWAESGVVVCCLVTKSCLTPCNPMDCNVPGSYVHGILQARILEWIAISSLGDLPDPGIEPTSPTLTGGVFTTKPPGKPWVSGVLIIQSGLRLEPGSKFKKILKLTEKSGITGKLLIRKFRFSIFLLH